MKTPFHRGAIMCKALVFISQEKYFEANRELDKLIKFYSTDAKIEECSNCVQCLQ